MSHPLNKICSILLKNKKSLSSAVRIQEQRSDAMNIEKSEGREMSDVGLGLN